MPRKRMARVLPIDGVNTPYEDVISEIDLEAVEDLQRAEWRAQRALQRAVERIEARIRQGARVEASQRYWDSELKMVRTRRLEER